MTDAVELAQHFEYQAQACEALGSPFTARLCRALPLILDTTSATGRRALEWPGDVRADALALRLTGGLHALVLSKADSALTDVYPPNATEDAELSAAVRGAIHRHDPRLAAGLDSPPQTNEIARSAMLLPGLLEIARITRLPLTICEIGASAGLNQLLDRFGYRYGQARWGNILSPVQLAPEVRGGPIPLDGDMTIAGKAACDLSPIDISRANERLRLRSYVWADQVARLERLDAAIALATAEPVSIVQADAADLSMTRW